MAVAEIRSLDLRGSGVDWAMCEGLEEVDMIARSNQTGSLRTGNTSVIADEGLVPSELRDALRDALKVALAGGGDGSRTFTRLIIDSLPMCFTHEVDCREPDRSTLREDERCDRELSCSSRRRECLSTKLFR